MMIFRTLILLMPIVYGSQTSWKTMIEDKRCIMTSQEYDLISAQVNAYEIGTSPKIADPVIAAIPIIESGEELVDVSKMVAKKTHKKVTMLPVPQEPFASPLCNSGLPSTRRIRGTVFVKLARMTEELDKLASAFGHKSGSMHIKVFEGLRDLGTQKMLFDNKLKEIRISKPTLSEDELIAETSKWVSPVVNNRPHA